MKLGLVLGFVQGVDATSEPANLLQSTSNLRTGGLGVASLSGRQMRQNQVATDLERSARERMETGAPPISSTLATALEDELDNVKQSLKGEAEDQRILAGNVNDPIKSCNTQKSNNFDHVQDLQNAVTGKINVHNTCRGQEFTTCGAYQAKAEAALEDGPTCINEAPLHAELTVDSNSVADTITNCMGQYETWVNNHYDGASGLSQAAEDCSAKVSTCNAAQQQAETDFCQYKQSLEDACLAHSQCLQEGTGSTLVDQRTAEKEVIQRMITGLQEMWTVIAKAQCYLNLLTVEAAVTEDALNGCRNLAFTEDDFAADDVKLTLTFDADTAPVGCDISDASIAPGHADWLSSKYEAEAPANQNWQNMLNQAVTPCVDADGNWAHQTNVKQNWLYVSDLMTVDEAEAHCVTLGRHLLSVHSQHELNEARAFLSEVLYENPRADNRKDAILGGRSTPSGNCDFTWTDGSGPVGSWIWNGGEPNQCSPGQHEKCIGTYYPEVSGYPGVNDQSCDYPRPSICGPVGGPASNAL